MWPPSSARTSCGRDNRQSTGTPKKKKKGEFGDVYWALFPAVPCYFFITVSCVEALPQPHQEHLAHVLSFNQGWCLCPHPPLSRRLWGNRRPLFMNLCCWWHLPRPSPPTPLSAETIAALPDDHCLSVDKQTCFRLVSTLNNDIYGHAGVVWTGLENITESQIKSVPETYQYLSTLNGPRPTRNRVFLISDTPVASGHFEFNISNQKSWLTNLTETQSHKETKLSPFLMHYGL